MAKSIIKKIKISQEVGQLEELFNFIKRRKDTLIDVHITEFIEYTEHLTYEEWKRLNMVEEIGKNA